VLPGSLRGVRCTRTCVYVCVCVFPREQGKSAISAPPREKRKRCNSTLEFCRREVSAFSLCFFCLCFCSFVNFFHTCSSKLGLRTPSS
jgi:hypothetical protein